MLTRRILPFSRFVVNRFVVGRRQWRRFERLSRRRSIRVSICSGFVTFDLWIFSHARWCFFHVLVFWLWLSWLLALDLYMLMSSAIFGSSSIFWSVFFTFAAGTAATGPVCSVSTSPTPIIPVFVFVFVTLCGCRLCRVAGPNPGLDPQKCYSYGRGVFGQNSGQLDKWTVKSKTFPCPGSRPVLKNFWFLLSNCPIVHRFVQCDPPSKGSGILKKLILFGYEDGVWTKLWRIGRLDS